MKKILLFFVCASAFVAAKAQVSYGLKAGLNVSNIVGSDAEGAKSKLGFHAGAFASIPVSGAFSVQPELVYSAQGAKYEQAGEDDVKLNTDYLNVPVLAKFTSASGFYGLTGPQIGFLLSAKAKQGSDDVDVKDFYNSTDFSWAFGVGYKTASNVGLDVRYNLGLSKLDKEGDAKAKNSVFQVGVFYVFGGK